MTTRKRDTVASLRRRVKELEAQLVSRLEQAERCVGDAAVERLAGSGVLLELSALGGRELIPPVVIRDGLSSATIEALREDIRRSWRLATMSRPRGVER